MVEDIVKTRLDNLAEAIEAAKNAKADPVIDPIKKAVEKICEVLYQAGAKDSLSAKLGGTEQADLLVSNFMTASTDVKNFLLINSTSEVNGEEAANRVKGLLMAEMIEGEDKERAMLLLEQWVAARPKKRAASGEGKTTPEPDFTFSSVAKCNDCDKDVYHEGSRSGQTRWAHLKAMIKSHNKADHGGPDIGELKDWTDARDKMAAGESTVTVGRYEIRRG